MRVLCAWCLEEGKPEAEALIGEREPLGEAGPPIVRGGVKAVRRE